MHSTAVHIVNVPLPCYSSTGLHFTNFVNKVIVYMYMHFNIKRCEKAQIFIYSKLYKKDIEQFTATST